MKVDIYIRTDFHGNPKGRGKSAAVIEYVAESGKVHTRIITAEITDGTKNALELEICVRSMKCLTKSCAVAVHMDNGYIKSAVDRGWVSEWQQCGWKKKSGGEIANKKLWQQFFMLIRIHSVCIQNYDGRYGAELEEQCRI